MVRYYKFTKNNNPRALLEYGNAEDPEQFKFLHVYSPCQHVTPGTKYPATLIISGDADTGVPGTGAQDGCAAASGDYVGFPFSSSITRRRDTRAASPWKNGSKRKRSN
jgi:prolyl oligopeptidase